jgi:hypothetical protein
VMVRGVDRSTQTPDCTNPTPVDLSTLPRVVIRHYNSRGQVRWCELRFVNSEREQLGDASGSVTVAASSSSRSQLVELASENVSDE